jgi:hypothetical protein
MEDYVRRHTAGSILRSAVRIYFQHAAILAASAFVPWLVVFGIELVRWQEQQAGWPVVLAMILSLFNMVPNTVLISDICVGNRPSLARAYRRAFGKETGTVLLTMVLVLVILAVGFLLLVVPGIVFSMWYSFAGPVVALERTTARRALTRSRELGKGYYLRNLGVFLLAALVILTPSFVLGVVWGAIVALANLPLPLSHIVGGVIGALIAPPISVAVVLLYYDLRVRKEAYDSAKLAEDLRR